jgi:hypothetical protein
VDRRRLDKIGCRVPNGSCEEWFDILIYRVVIGSDGYQLEGSKGKRCFSHTTLILDAPRNRIQQVLKVRPDFLFHIVIFRESTVGGQGFFATLDTAALAIQDLLNPIRQLFRPIFVLGLWVLGRIIERRGTATKVSIGDGRGVDVVG